MANHAQRHGMRVAFDLLKETGEIGCIAARKASWIRKPITEYPSQWVMYLYF
jgi:hypothetical protein